jgi:hypothetical protein
MKTTQAHSIQEIIDRLSKINCKYDDEAKAEAAYLLCDALILLRQSDVVSAFIDAKHRSGL